MLIRLIFRTKSLSPSRLSFWTTVLIHVLSTGVARYLSKMGEPRRSTTGELILPGEDLNQPGVIEWCFDIIYVTCECAVPSFPIIDPQTAVPGACQIGSAIFGEKFWWFITVVNIASFLLSRGCIMTNTLQIPLYAFYKIWTSFLGPYLGIGKSLSSSDENEDNNTPQHTSKRQEKLKKRSERGDPRVQAKTIKKHQ